MPERLATETTWLTSQDVADLLGVNLRTVHTWIRSGQLPAINVGGRTGYRIAQDAVEQYVMSRRVRRTAESELMGTNE